MPKCEVDLSLPVLRAVLDEKHFERCVFLIGTVKLSFLDATYSSL